ncbi:MAG: hypothetical protein PHD82_16510, partial [Candidatus Riflebacteria bacterium]|nr:hypothetical protein [Candidatus Riflebacteria bacterium]
MKNIVIIFFLCLALANAGVAGAAAVASRSLELKAIDGTLSIETHLDTNGVTLKILGAEGKEIFASENLGSEDKLFMMGDQATGLATHDFDGDGNPEILVSAFYGPQASGLYVFRYDTAAGKFAPVKFLNSTDAELSTENLVSDIRQENGSDMVVKEDGSL